VARVGGTNAATGHRGFRKEKHDMKNVLRFTLAALALAGFVSTDAFSQTRVSERVSWRTSAAAYAGNSGVRDSVHLCVAGAAGTMVFDTTLAVSLDGLHRGATIADSAFAFAFVVSPANVSGIGMATAIDSLNVYAQFSANGRDWWDGTGGKSFLNSIGGSGSAGRSFSTTGATLFAGNSPSSAFAGARFVRFVIAHDFNGCIEGWVTKLLGDAAAAGTRNF
jgi:hypothetical protein